jgi:NAD(P)-dependent dehydrogenase (short-subunit alcohol dehydrogenase family)
MSRQLEGRIAIVTGGAGAIGDAICTEFAREGAAVVVADIDETRTNATVDRVAAHGGTAVPFVADLTDGDAIKEMVACASRRLGTVDILVNGLGEHLRSAGPFEESDESTWQALYEVNLLHIFRACREVVPLMKERGWGRIVNLSSVEGVRSAPALAVYAAFKGAIDGFTKSLGVDLARYGIRVNAIAIDKTRAYQVDHYRLPPEYEHLVPTWIPAGRYGEPVDIAAIALFLAGETSSWIVGQTIVADGGTVAAGGWFRTPRRWTNQPLLVQYFEPPDVSAGRPETLR